MLKRFLKFLKRDPEGVDVSEISGSYLRHLMDSVREQFAVELGECPDHDPVVLLVALIFHQSMPDEWAPEFARPLTDSQSPAPTVVVPTDAEVGNDELHEDIEFDRTAEFQALDHEVDLGLDDEEESEPDDDAPDGLGSNDANLQMSLRRTAELVMEADDDPLAAPHDRTIEDSNAKPRVDLEEVLQAGRVFLDLLVANDRLPLDLQLGVSDMLLARDLLLGYVFQRPSLEANGRKLLARVEQKFADGLFSQARLLLRLFQTDRTTQISNDRNLFYEDMIMKLGIRRRHSVPRSERESTSDLVRGQQTVDGAARALFEQLEAVYYVKLHLYTVDEEELAAWQQLVEPSTRKLAARLFLQFLPPRRWRTTAELPTKPVAEQVQVHLTNDAVRAFVVSHIKACYFVLRAVGDTGLEPYLDTFFEWTRREFDMNGTRIMPQLYTRSMSDEAVMDYIFDDVYDQFFRERAEARIANISAEEIESALSSLTERLLGSELNEVAPGNYDLGGLILDDVFGVTYEAAEFAFKVHRLT